MGMIDYEREHKVAISMYPFLERKIESDSMESYLELDSRAREDKVVIVYIHIPFCDSICDFCVYNRIKSEASIMQDYVNALVREIRMYAKKDYVRETRISAIYIGGGTPTSLSKTQLNMILDACWKELNVCSETEFTIETNPINASGSVLEVLSQFSINRISAGIQTFNDRHRSNLGVMRNGKRVLEWIDMVSKYKFETVAVDLMYGLPNQTEEEWVDDLEIAISQPIDHLSIYELDVFSNTKLWKGISSGALSFCSGKDKYQMFLDAQDILAKNNYNRLIIPEFYKDNHMSTYWKLAFDAWVDTIALGCSSFGFINRRSYQNEDSINDYIQRIQQGRFPIKYVSGRATDNIMAERNIIFSLRKGYIRKSDLEKEKELSTYRVYEKILESHITNGLLLEDDQFYTLSQKGCYFQEDVAVDYMFSTFENRSMAYKKLVLGRHIF